MKFLKRIGLEMEYSHFFPINILSVWLIHNILSQTINYVLISYSNNEIKIVYEKINLLLFKLYSKLKICIIQKYMINIYVMRIIIRLKYLFSERAYF